MVVNIINLHTVNVKNWIKEPNNIYIGRRTKGIKASKWKNPFKINYCNSRKKAVRLFEKYIKRKRNLVNSISELKGKVLGCWCAPKLCHAQILHHLAGNEPVYQSRAATMDSNMRSESLKMDSESLHQDSESFQQQLLDKELTDIAVKNVLNEMNESLNMDRESYQQESESFQQQLLDKELTDIAVKNVLTVMNDMIENSENDTSDVQLPISEVQPPIPPVDTPDTTSLEMSTVETKSAYETLLQPVSADISSENVSVRSEGPANSEDLNGTKVTSNDARLERLDIRRRIINLQLQQLSNSSHTPSLLSPSRNLVNGRRHSLPSSFMYSFPLPSSQSNLFEYSDSTLPRKPYSAPTTPTKEHLDNASNNSKSDTLESPPSSFTYDSSTVTPLTPTLQEVKDHQGSDATQRILEFLADKVDQLTININTIQFNLNQISESIKQNQMSNSSTPDSVKSLEESMQDKINSLEESMQEKLSFLENKLDYQKINFDIEFNAMREENENLRKKLDHYILQEADREERIKECFNSPQNIPNCIADLQPLKEDLENKLLELDIRVLECEQYSRRENLIISGIPNTVDQKNLQQTVINILGLIGLKIIPDDISACHRLFNPPGSYFPAKVIVRFGNRKIVNFCLDHKEDLQQKAFDQLRWNLRFFESLCSKNEETLRICKRLSQQQKIHDYYIRNGFVKVVAHENGRPEKIKHPDLLRKKFDIPEEV